jgi:hypothetical protein
VELVAITLWNDGLTKHDFTVKQIDREQACRLNGDPPSIDLTDREDVHVALIPKTSVELRQRVTKRGEYKLYTAWCRDIAGPGCGRR